MGMNIQNLSLLLKTTDDFELHIIDNNSSDDSWEFIQQLKDPRIKEVKRFPFNKGGAYAFNYVLSQRKPGQAFINVEADVSIYTPNWISNCVQIIDTYPEVGAVGNVRPTFFKERSIEYTEMTRDDVKFWRSLFLLGCCVYYPAKTMDLLGYYNEMILVGDLEITARLAALGNWFGYCLDNQIRYRPPKCSTCDHKGLCKNPDPTDKKNPLHCFDVYNKSYKQRDVTSKMMHRFLNYSKDLTKDTVYCASIHDTESQSKTFYNELLAKWNFNLFEE